MKIIGQETTKTSWDDLKQEGIVKTIETNNGEIIDCVNIDKQPSFVNSLIKDLQLDKGEIIDCVDIYKQPAFDNPLIKDLQMEPNYYPFGNKLDSNLTLKMLQDWHKYGECPEGTIPIRRRKSYDHPYHKRRSLMMRQQINQSFSKDIGHEHAIVSDQGSSYYGASGIFNVWNPQTEDNEFSLSQMWIVTSYNKEDFYNNLNSIEVGWAVNPITYKDKETRLFIYWTNDGYSRTGCYDLNCKGFVQTSSTHALGMEIKPVSTFGGESRVIPINVFKDKMGDKWWLQVLGSIVGYWPAVIFPDLKNNANLVEWGGEILNRKNDGYHTTTQMGSGKFPEKGFSQSCYIHSLKVLDDGLVPRDPGNLVDNDEIIDCVDIYKQPAFDDPLIKNDFQMEPSSYPFGMKLDSNLTLEILQDWHKNEECPEGTVPIRRNTSYGNFHPIKSSHFMRQQINQSLSQVGEHQYALVIDGGSPYYGASGVFNLWNPRTENTELSSSQMWIITRYDNEYDNYNTIEVGWMVYPELYKDKQTRLFICWTRDGYQTTGCYDLTCSGFVQTNRNYAFGLPLRRVSIEGGEMREISIDVFREEHRWWLLVHGTILGYWPTAIFTDLKKHANIVEWGGKIVNNKNYGYHTSTQMGSGEFPNKGFGKSCNIHSLKVLDGGLIRRDPGNLGKIITKPACYDLTLTKNRGSSFETHIFFGGPGFSPTCL
ncbi:uncharacterized protein LOC124944965 [Impatiens glandulifera]|uniref:uncharacterized protein LOC124944965 n=1 Tax=Impatiens glandulifera TaxID=253017 RepID=UPI001FB14EDD|nr:uncharacterized protein LOC124944965 [Impatiens glandulifera]